MDLLIRWSAGDRGSPRSTTLRVIGALLLAIALAGACGGSDDESARPDQTVAPSPTVETTPAPTPEPTVPPSPEPTGPPTPEPAPTSEPTAAPTANPSALPARSQLDWVLGTLADGQELTVNQVEDRFSPAFLAQLPATEIIGFFAQIVQFAEPPFAVEQFDASPDGLSATARLLSADGQRIGAQIAVSPSAPNLIEAIGFAPAELEFSQPIAIEAIDKRLTDLGPQSSLGVYDVSSGACVAVHEVRADSAIVLGSVFKLWVLAALADEIDAGRATWDETVALSDRLRSTPDGEIYALETGTEVSLERLAQAMISISDNTATDMLLDRLGRPAVEQAMVRVGLADPSANIPMMSTGDIFALKFVPDAPNAADYRALDEAGKRQLLDDLGQTVLPWVGADDAMLAELSELPNADGLAMDQPRDLDIEWFASAEEVCLTLVHLGELAEIPGLEPIGPILEANPGAGIPFDRDRWPTIRFKGGSEPGVLAGAWWFEGPDGDRFVVAGGVANPDTAFDELDAVLTIASAIELID